MPGRPSLLPVLLGVCDRLQRPAAVAAGLGPADSVADGFADQDGHCTVMGWKVADCAGEG